ncbi:MAG: septum formation protein Maf [Clostridia bacterium]|nr:septum formation protein Maf [Clostridia bacterium]
MVILASSSPRRKELLSYIFNNFDILPANIDENIDNDCSIELYPELLAVRKARHAFRLTLPDNMVIGCDTGVFIDGEMLGKPKNEHDAAVILKKLSGKTHKVITGCCVISGHNEISFSQTTDVSFYELTDSEIEDYIATGEPIDKAGAYGIQGKGALFVKEIRGDYYNVVGLPISRLKREIMNIYTN